MAGLSLFLESSGDGFYKADRAPQPWQLLQLTQCLHCHLLVGLGIALLAFDDLQLGSWVVLELMRGAQTGAPAMQLSLASSPLSSGFPTPSSALITRQGQPESYSQGRWYPVHLVTHPPFIIPGRVTMCSCMGCVLCKS